MALKFTNASLEKLEVKDAPYTESDTQVPHLRVRVHPTGRKVFFYQFKENGKQFRGNLGEVGDLAVEEARAQARTKRVKTDAFYEKPSETVSIADLAQAFLFEFVPKKALSTQPDYVRHTKWLVEAYGKLNVSSVNRMTAKGMVLNYVGKSRSNATFNRVKATFSSMWTFGMQNLSENVIETNPFRDLSKLIEGDRSEIYATEEQLGRIIRSVLDEENKIIRAYHGLIIYTMCRRGEADKMTWGQIADGVWTKPKTNTKGKRTHRIKITKEVEALLDSIPKGKNDDLVFQNFQGFGKAWKRILERAGLPYPGLRVHDMRGTMAVWLLKHKLATVEEVSNMLGHSNVAVTQAKYAPYIGDNADVAQAVAKAPIETEEERDKRFKELSLKGR